MAKFNRVQFRNIIEAIENAELAANDIWLPVGILEYMYDDDYGWIDEYFHTDFDYRDWEELWNKLNFD